MAEKHTESSLAVEAKAPVSAKKRTNKASGRPLTGTKRAAISEKTGSPVLVSPALRHQMIAEAAYYLAQRRGFIPGYEEEDWLAAELQIDAERSC